MNADLGIAVSFLRQNSKYVTLEQVVKGKMSELRHARIPLKLVLPRLFIEKLNIEKSFETGSMKNRFIYDSKNKRYIYYASCFHFCDISLFGCGITIL